MSRRDRSRLGPSPRRDASRAAASLPPRWSWPQLYSDSEGADCVETAPATDTVHVRDSKDTRRPALTFPRTTWTRFLQHTER